MKSLSKKENIIEVQNLFIHTLTVVILMNFVLDWVMFFSFYMVKTKNKFISQAL